MNRKQLHQLGAHLKSRGKRYRKKLDSRKVEFGEKAFGTESGAVAIIKYEAQQRALDFIWRVLGDETAIGLIQGPEGSGKTTVVQQLIKELPQDASVAAIDGTRSPRATPARSPTGWTSTRTTRTG